MARKRYPAGSLIAPGHQRRVLREDYVPQTIKIDNEDVYLVQVGELRKLGLSEMRIQELRIQGVLK